MWPVLKRIAHAAGWLAELWSEPPAYDTPFAVLMAVLASSVTVVFVLLWWRAVRDCWSLKWPIIVLLAATLPFGVPAISMIGIGMLIIWWVGRGNTTAPSRMRGEPAAIAAPQGLVEDRRGAGLVAVMVSVTVLAIALTAATSAFMSASRLTRHAAHFARASNYAEGVMERVSSQPFRSIKNTDIEAPAALPGGQCVVSVTDRKGGLKEVTVTCSWVEGETSHRARFSTLVAEGQQR